MRLFFYLILGGYLLLSAASFADAASDVSLQISFNQLTAEENENLLDNLTQDDMSSWRKAFAAAKQFVMDNGMGDKDITKALNEAVKINMDLLNAINIASGSYRSKSILDKEVGIFKQLATDAKKALTALSKAIFILNRAKKLQAKSVLLTMLRAIAGTADKAAVDTKAKSDLHK